MLSSSIRILQPGDEPALEAFLQQHLETSLFLLSNLRLAGLIDQGRRYQGTYAAAFQGEEIVGVVAHYWLGNLIYQAPQHVIPLQQAAIRASGRQVKGLLGPSAQVGQAMNALDVAESDLQMDDPQNLYSLPLSRLVVPAILGSGQVRGRRVRPDDVELLTTWRIAYSLEIQHEEDTPELRIACRQSVERYLESGLAWVLERDGAPVATNTFNATLPEVVQVGGVWTPPELRSRGYGRSVVAASLLDAHDQGWERAILFTDVDNLPAQRAYEALGFQRIGDYRIVRVK